MVKDINKTEDFLKSIGIPLKDYVHPGKYTVLEGSNQRIADLSPNKHIETTTGHVQVTSQLGDDDTSRRRFIDKYTNRVYSVGFLVENVDKAEAECVRLGIKPLRRGRHEDGWAYTYLDTLDLLGVYLTIRQNPTRPA